MRVLTGPVCLTAILLICKTTAVPQQEQRQAAIAESARNFRFQTLEYISPDNHNNQFTTPVAINDNGVIVGDIHRMNVACFDIADCGGGMFIYQNGKFHLLAGPVFQGHFTRAIAINNRDQILLVQENRGGVMNAQNQWFVYDMRTDSFRPVGPFVTVAGAPGPVRMNAINGFNDEGEFVGSYNFRGKFWSGYGMLTLGSAGSTAVPTAPAGLTVMECPEGRTMRAMAINNHRQITGACEGGSKQPVRRGFLFDKGAITLFDVPGANLTQGNGINDAGAIVGEYTLKPLHAGMWPVMGFAYDGSQFSSVAQRGSPNGMLSQAKGINSRGQIVGMDGDGNRGFVAMPTSGNKLQLSGR